MDIQSAAAPRPPIGVQNVSQLPAAEEAPQEQPKAPLYDEYTPEDKVASQPIGLYEVVPDEDGRPTIRFDDPGKAGRTEQTTTNTDQVDRELERLRQKAEKLQRQCQKNADPQQAQRLQRQLRQVENELRQKDNDAYRRQHAVIS